MRSYYEKMRDDSGELLIQHNARGTFPAHFHRNLEIVLAKSGSYEILINGRMFKTEGDAVIVIDSFDLHEYIRRVPDAFGRLENEILVIPYSYVHSFHEYQKKRSLAQPVICDETLTERLMTLIRQYLNETESEAVRKSTVQLMLSILAEHLQWTEEPVRGEVELARQILSYIHENYQKAIRRSDIARVLGYTQAHISRVFHSYLSMGILEYVGRLRLDYVENAIENGDHRSLAVLISEAGFNSQQTYYRLKKKFASRTEENK